jgi:RNA polymerase sigma-70 factor (ECF subfamily)
MVTSDEAAVQQVLGGDRDAFRVLVERHSRHVFRVGYRMTGNEQDAEEVVQETFLRAYRRLDGFKFDSAFSTWLQRIAANCSVDLLERRNRHEKGRVQPKEEDDEPIELPSGAPNPERLILSGEVGRRVAEVMDTLSPSERTAFVMRHFEGNSIEEIGKTLGIADGATKNCIFRAVQKMRSALEPLVRPAR